jgi:hypothetical protein
MNNNTTLEILHSQSINVQHFAMCFLFSFFLMHVMSICLKPSYIPTEYLPFLSFSNYKPIVPLYKPTTPPGFETGKELPGL